MKYGLAEGNKIYGSRSYGISIGHRDTENLIVDNEVVRSGKVGVLFRPDEARILPRTAIRWRGTASSIAALSRASRSTCRARRKTSRSPATRSKRPADLHSGVGIRLGTDTSQVRLEENQFHGLSRDVEDLRTKGQQ